MRKSIADLQKMLKEGAMVICMSGLIGFGAGKVFLGIVGLLEKPRYKFGKYYTAAQVEAWAEDVRRRNERGARSDGEFAEEYGSVGWCSPLEDSVKQCLDRHHHDGGTTTPVPSRCQIDVIFLSECLKKAGMLPTTTTTTTTTTT